MAHDTFGLVGTVIDGRYRVDHVVGEGGFGVVYRGFHLGFEQSIAIKCLKIPAHFTPEASSTFVARFREEGKLLSRLSESPGIVRVFDFGVVHSHIEVPYLVLEWLEGRSLEDYLVQRLMQGYGPCAPLEAVQMLLPAVEALAFAHSLRIAHRDIKPANLFLAMGPRGVSMKVLDFGIAKAMQDGESQTQASTGTSSGFHAFSPMYGAPEQFFSKRYGASGPWTDVHALGLVLVEMVSGRKALYGEDTAELLEASTRDVRPTPRVMGVNVPDGLEWLCSRALAKMPGDRFQDAAQMLEVFHQILGTTPHVQSAVAYATPPPQTVLATSLPSMLRAGGDASVQITPNRAENVTPYGASAYNPTQLGAPLVGAIAASTQPTPITGPITDRNQGVSVQRDEEGVPPTVVTKPRRRWPLVVAGVGLVGTVGLFALVALIAGGDFDLTMSGATDASTPETPASSATAQDGVVDVRHFSIGKDIVGVLPISASEARTVLHDRLTLKNGRVVKIESLSPSGSLSKELRVDYAADGTRTLHSIDANHIETEVTVIRSDGVATTTSRGGIVSKDGCYRQRNSYDARGRVETLTCVSNAGTVIIDAMGCAVRRFAYNDVGLISQNACFTEDGKPAADQDGVHLTKIERDALGRVTELSFFDPSGAAATRPSDGCARLRSEYDAAGNKLNDRCFNASGTPTPMQGRSWSARWVSYDANGCATRARYADVSGKWVADGETSEIVIVPDARCNTVREERRGPQGQLIKPGTWGVPLTKLEIGNDGQPQSKDCFGADDKPTNCEGNGSTSVGVKARYSYDDRGRLTSERYFTADGALSAMSHAYPHETRFTYGPDGRVASRAFFDDKGKPATALGKVARFTYRYDPLGGLLSSAMFDTSGNPIASSIGCHDLAQSFDEKHRLAVVECRGPTGALAAHVGLIYGGIEWPAGAARMQIERSTTIFNSYFDPNNKPTKRVDCTKRETPCYR